MVAASRILRGRSSIQRNLRAVAARACAGLVVGVIFCDSQRRRMTTPANDPASARNTGPVPTVAIRNPAKPGPAILARPVTMLLTDAPRRSSLTPTRSSMNIWPAGRPTVCAQPMPKPSTHKYQMVIHPASSGTPIASAPAHSAIVVTASTRLRRRRSVGGPARVGARAGALSDRCDGEHPARPMPLGEEPGAAAKHEHRQELRSGDEGQADSMTMGEVNREPVQRGIRHRVPDHRDRLSANEPPEFRAVAGGIVPVVHQILHQLRNSAKPYPFCD